MDWKKHQGYGFAKHVTWSAQSGPYYLHAWAGGWSVGVFARPDLTPTSGVCYDVADGIHTAESWLLGQLRTWADSGVCPDAILVRSKFRDGRMISDPAPSDVVAITGAFSVGPQPPPFSTHRLEIGSVSLDLPVDEIDCKPWPHPWARPRGGAIALELDRGSVYVCEPLVLDPDTIVWVIRLGVLVGYYDRDERYRVGQTRARDGHETRSAIGTRRSIETGAGRWLYGKQLSRMVERLER